MAGIVDTIELDISDALSSVDRLFLAFQQSSQQSAQQLGVALSGAMDVLREPVAVTADVSGIAPAIDAAIDAADSVLVVEADTTGVPEEVAAAIDTVDGVVPVEADASGVADEITSAIEEADTAVAVTADVSGALEEIQALEGEDVTVAVTADTAAAEQSLTDLGQAAGQAKSPLDDLGGSLGVVQVASAAAVGDMTNLTGAAGKLSGPAGIAAGSVLALGGAAAVLVANALGARESADTFRIAVGDLGDEVSRIDVGGLNIDLGELATQLGNDDEAAFNAASRLVQFAEAAGAARETIPAFSDEILALSARAVALNPDLGEIGTTAEAMVGALARGGRALTPFGLSITAAEIAARALRDTGKETAAELSIYDRAAAGAAIATERLGDSLAGPVQERIDSTATGFARLRQEMANTLEAAGDPILDPLLEQLEDIQPELQDTATAFGELVVAVIPVAEAFAPLLTGSLAATADSLSTVSSAIATVTGPLDDLLSLLPATADGEATIGALVNEAMRALNPVTAVGDAVSDVGEIIGGIFGDDADDGVSAFSRFRQALDDGSPAIGGLIDIARGAAEQIAAIGAESDITAQELIDLRGATDALFGSMLGAEQAGIAYEGALDRLQAASEDVWVSQTLYNDAVRKFGADSPQAREAAEKLDDAQRDLHQSQLNSVTSARDFLTAIDEQTAAMQVAGPETALLKDELIRLRDRFPELRAEIDKHIAKIDAIPDSAGTVVTVDTAAAGLAIRNFQTLLNAIDTDIEIRFRARGFDAGDIGALMGKSLAPVAFNAASGGSLDPVDQFASATAAPMIGELNVYPAKASLDERALVDVFERSRLLAK